MKDIFQLTDELAKAMGADTKALKREFQYHDYLFSRLFAPQSLQQCCTAWDKRCALADLCGCKPEVLNTPDGHEKIKALLKATDIQLESSSCQS